MGLASEESGRHDALLLHLGSKRPYTILFTSFGPSPHHAVEPWLAYWGVGNKCRSPVVPPRPSYTKQHLVEPQTCGRAEPGLADLSVEPSRDHRHRIPAKRRGNNSNDPIISWAITLILSSL